MGGDFSPLCGFGGHSRFSLSSSLAESPVSCDRTLELRGEAELLLGLRFKDCSKRPMRLATLARGLSSGNGLGVDGSIE